MKVGKTVCKMQNNVFPTVFYMWNCANGSYATLGHNMFFDITNCLHERGTAARRAGVQ